VPPTPCTVYTPLSSSSLRSDLINPKQRRSYGGVTRPPKSTTHLRNLGHAIWAYICARWQRPFFERLNRGCVCLFLVFFVFRCSSRLFVAVGVPVRGCFCLRQFRPLVALYGGGCLWLCMAVCGGPCLRQVVVCGCGSLSLCRLWLSWLSWLSVAVLGTEWIMLFEARHGCVCYCTWRCPRPSVALATGEGVSVCG
jgi:hypothetical protein